MSDVPETALPPLPEAYIPLLEHYTASQMKAYARAAIEAAVREQPAAGTVKLPTNADEAELMAKMGLLWLDQNAPERLTKPQQGDSAVASEGGSCVSALAELVALEAMRDSLPKEDPGFWSNEAVETYREYLRRKPLAWAAARAALSTAGAQRRASEQDETTSAKEQR